ncbi:MAG: hypothetical protein M3R51_09485 [Candidatus Eremiobacteraeota bacterium]|nr:hypothetical protein [Candidatus Eremiobacteraeota bacterium]
MTATYTPTPTRNMSITQIAPFPNPTAPPQSFNVTLNAMLGGGVADAAFPPCAVNPPRAFSDADGDFTTPIVSGSAPYRFGVSINAGGVHELSGCADRSTANPSVVLNEKNYLGQLVDG